MKDKVIIGCDISKLKIDIFCRENKESFLIKNNNEGFNKLALWIQQHKLDPENLIIAFEHTGAYGKAITNYCLDNHIDFLAINALAIKLSLGITRGKNDIIDAIRIAEYVFEKQYKLSPTKPIDTEIERLKNLRTSRDLLVKHRASFLTALKIDTETLMLSKQDIIVQSKKTVVDGMTTNIKKLEAEIGTIIISNKELTDNYKLLLSIVGIGPIIALDTILATNNFKNFSTWRKYASYCGCAPFTNSSGKMIKQNRISNLANKNLKANLSSGAKSAQRHDQELKLYAERKLAGGKSKKCITNVIRCKLIARMFSVIKNKKEYQKNYTHHLVVSTS